jgi:hypothetical protein
VKRHAGKDNHSPLVQRRASLPLADKQRLIPLEMPMSGDLGTGQERLGACGKRRAG